MTIRFFPSLGLGVLAIWTTMAASAFGQIPAAQQATSAAPAGNPLPPVAPEVVRRDEFGRVSIRAVRVDRAHQGRRPARRGRLPSRRRRSAASSSRSRTRASRHREDRGLGLLRRQEHLRLRALLGQPARADGRQRDAARQQQHLPERELHGRLRHLPRPAQRLLLPDQPARRAARRLVTDEGSHQRRLEHGLGRAGRSHDDQGWTIEMAIPFKSLRYNAGAATRSGASTCGAPCAGRTRTRSSRRDAGGATAAAGIYKFSLGGDAGRPRSRRRRRGTSS